VSAAEKRRFRKRAAAFRVMGCIAVVVSTVMALASVGDKVPGRELVVTFTGPYGLGALCLASELVGLGCYVLLVTFVQGRSLIPWREVSSGAGRAQALVNLLVIPDAEGLSGPMVALILVLVVGVYVLLASGLAIASPSFDRVMEPRSPHHTPKPNGAANGGSNGHLSLGSGPAHGSSPTHGGTPTTTPTTQPPKGRPAALSDPGCSDIANRLADGLGVVTGQQVALEYANHLADLPCLALTSDGQLNPLPLGGLTAIDFTEQDGVTPAGTIVFDAAGDTATILAGEQGLTDAMSTDNSVTSVSELIEIHGAQLQIAGQDDGSCYLEMRAKADADWRLYPPQVAPAILQVFLGMHQIGLPLPGSGLFEFSYGEPDVSVVARGDAHADVSGASSSLAEHASAVDRCASAQTLETTPMSGPPSP
jgi:hypothetical protein